jgi:hypothetical protein
MFMFFRIGAGTTAAVNLDKKLVPKHDNPEKGSSSTPVSALPLKSIITGG